MRSHFASRPSGTYAAVAADEGGDKRTPLPASSSVAASGSGFKLLIIAILSVAIVIGGVRMTLQIMPSMGGGGAGGLADVETDVALAETQLSVMLREIDALRAKITAQNAIAAATPRLIPITGPRAVAPPPPPFAYSAPTEAAVAVFEPPPAAAASSPTPGPRAVTPPPAATVAVAPPAAPTISVAATPECVAATWLSGEVGELPLPSRLELSDASRDAITPETARKFTEHALQHGWRGTYMDRAKLGCATGCNTENVNCKTWPLPGQVKMIKALLNDPLLVANFKPTGCGVTSSAGCTWAPSGTAEVCFVPSEPRLFMIDVLEAAGALKNHFVVNAGCAVQEVGQELSYDVANMLMGLQGWSGLGIDAPGGRTYLFADRVAKTPRRADSAKHPLAFEGFIKAENLEKIFRDHGVPRDLAMLKVDIDSIDCRVIEAALDAKYRPITIHVEAMSGAPPSIAFATSEPWRGCSRGAQFFGCSCEYIRALAKKHEYIVVSSFDTDMTLLDARLDVAKHFNDDASPCNRCAGHRHAMNELSSYAQNDDPTRDADAVWKKWTLMEQCGHHEQLAEELSDFVQRVCPDVDFELSSAYGTRNPLVRSSEFEFHATRYAKLGGGAVTKTQVGRERQEA